MEEDVGLDSKFLFVTCGDWDLKTMLPSQCALDNIPVPAYCKTWLNIKKVIVFVSQEMHILLLMWIYLCTRLFWLMIPGGSYKGRTKEVFLYMHSVLSH